MRFTNPIKTRERERERERPYLTPKCFLCGPPFFQSSSLDQGGLWSLNKALLQNPREMIRGRIFSEMIRISARKSELQVKSRSYKPPGRPPKSEPNRPEKAPESGFGASTETPLKAFLNPPKIYSNFSCGTPTTCSSDTYPLTQNYYENHSLRIAFRHF